MGISENEVKKALLESTYGSMGNCFVKNNAYDAAEDIFNLVKLVNKVANSKNALYSVEFSAPLKISYVRMGKYGKEFANAMQVMPDIIQEQFSHHKFHPYIELFIRKVSTINHIDLLSVTSAGNHAYLIRVVDKMNEVVDGIRAEANSEEFKKYMDKSRRASRKNYLSLVAYIDKLFEVKARLLVMRVDFSYKWEHKNIVSAELAKRHRKQFFMNARSNIIFQNMVGYAWKLEYGRDKGYHYHMLFLFDGSNAQKDINIAKQIGEYWVNTVTDGKGLYFNCNRIKSSYKSCGIGMINYFDTQLRDGLKQAVLYMTKPDIYIKLLVPGKGRTFGRGEVRAPKCVNRGRPRGRM